MVETTAADRPAEQRRRARPRLGRVRANALGRVGVYLALAFGALVMLMPFIWQILTSFKSESESIAAPPVLIPPRWNLDNYAKVFDLIPFLNMYSVSVLVALCTIVAHVALGALAAFGFVFLRFRGRNVIFFVLLATIMVPKQLLVVPQYEIVQHLGLLNTVPGLILPMLPSMFSVFLLRQFMLTLPPEIVEAARIDGANPWRIFWSVVLPLVRPGLAAVAIFTLVYSWNDLLWPLVVMNDLDRMPLTLGLTNLQGEFTANDPLVMAASTMAVLPVLAIFFALQKRFIEGIAFTGSKG